MNLNFYQQLIQNLPIPYAYHHIICNSEGKPCDYEFIEINSAYENFTGLTKKEIIGRRATQIFSAMGNKGLDWIKCFGGLALNGGQKEFEHYAEEQKKWYKIIAYSPQKFYFTTFFIDISAEKKQAARQFNINDKQTEKPIILAGDSFRILSNFFPTPL